MSFVNYMDNVSAELQEETGDPGVLANGSILLPFDTDKGSPIEEEVPEDMGPQELYVLANTNDFAKSTVDADIAVASAGVVDVGGPVKAKSNEVTGQVAAKQNEVAGTDTTDEEPSNADTIEQAIDIQEVTEQEIIEPEADNQISDTQEAEIKESICCPD